MAELRTEVQRNRIIVGAVEDLQIDDVSVGATAGEATIRREIEFYDVEVEQALGVIKKFVVSDKRTLEVSLAEANLPNLHRAWDDAGGVIVSQTYADFDASEALPTGMASDGTKLFLLGDTNDGLYTVDDQGKATRVKAKNAVTAPLDFGQSTGAEMLPRGILIDADGQGYITGETGNELYTLELEDGTAAALSSPATDFGAAAEEMPRGMATDGTTVWMVGVNNAGLMTLVLSTGVATVLGTATDFGVAEVLPYGLTWVPDDESDPTVGTLFMLGQTNAALYTVDTTTGAATRVGDATNFSVGAILPTGLAWHKGSLWMADQTTKKVYKLDRATGIASQVGDVDTLQMNTPDNDNLEHTIIMVGPGADGRRRKYTLFRAVSMSQGEHMVQKGGMTMIPLNFEILLDPQKEEGANFGRVEDVPTLADAA